MTLPNRIAQRLRREPAERLPRLLLLYGPDKLAAKLITREIIRRRQQSEGTIPNQKKTIR